MSPLPPCKHEELTPRSQLVRLKKAELKLHQCRGDTDAPVGRRSLETVFDDLEKRSICKALSFDEASEGLDQKTLVEQRPQGSGWKLPLPCQLERRDMTSGRTALKAVWLICAGRIRVTVYPDIDEDEGAGFQDDGGA